MLFGFTLAHDLKRFEGEDFLLDVLGELLEHLSSHEAARHLHRVLELLQRKLMAEQSNSRVEEVGRLRAEVFFVAVRELAPRRPAFRFRPGSLSLTPLQPVGERGQVATKSLHLRLGVSFFLPPPHILKPQVRPTVSGVLEFGEVKS